MIKHIVNISGGAASALSLIRVIERHGTDSLSACFADVGYESDDLYAFVGELEAYCGVNVTRLSQGLTTWDVFEQRSMWTSPHGGCVASYHLKKLPLRAHAETIGSPESSVIYVGFGPDEPERMERLRKAAAPWKFDFPLTWKPKLGRCDVLDDLRSRGLHPPDAYERGYSHANCRQACVLAGIGQWSKLCVEDPATFRAAEEHEQRMLATMRETGRTVQTILRDRRGGESAGLSLVQLRAEIASGKRVVDSRYDADSCSCMGMLWE